MLQYGNLEKFSFIDYRVCLNNNTREQIYYGIMMYTSETNSIK